MNMYAVSMLLSNAAYVQAYAAMKGKRENMFSAIAK